MRIKTDIKVQCNKSDLLVFNKENNKLNSIDIRITSLSNLQLV